MTVSPDAQAGSVRKLLLLTGLLAAAAAILLMWQPWGLGAAAAGDPPADLDGGSGLVGEVGKGASGAVKGEPTEGVAEDDAPARERVVAATTLSGVFRSPAGVWPGGGTVELHPAPELPEGGFMGAMSELWQLPRRAASGKQTSSVQKGVMKSFFGLTESVAEKALDPLGAFVLEDPPPGDYVLQLRHPHLVVAKKVEVTIESNEHTDAGTVDTLAASSLLVLVSDPDGSAVEGAKLELGRKIDMSEFTDLSFLEDMQSMMRRFIPKTGKTDQRGAYRFEGLQSPSWTLAVRARDLVEDVRPIHLLPGRENLVRVELSRGAALEIHVAGTGGLPHHRARVRVRAVDVGDAKPAFTSTVDSVRAEGRTVRTGEDGVVRVGGLVPGATTVQLKTPGFLPEERTVHLERDNTTRVDFTLDLGVTVAGRVVDEDGQPLAGAHVAHIELLGQKFMGMDLGNIVGNDLISLGIEKRGVTTDDAGRFVLGGFESGAEANLIAVATGFDAGRLDDVVAGTVDAELRLLRSTQLRGIVLAEPDGEPVQSFEVRLEKRAWVVIDRPVVVEQFEVDDGVFQIDAVPRESFKLVVAAEGRATLTKRVNLREGSLDVGELRLEMPSSLEGITVDPAGNPIPGVSVHVSKGGAVDSVLMAKFMGRRIVTSDDDGRFRLEGLSGRRMRLLADKEGFAPFKSKTITLVKGDTTRDVVLRLTRGGSLLGRVVNGEGEPLSEWQVQVGLTSGRSLSTARTDAAGQFVVKGLAAGPHKVEAFPSDYMEKFGGDMRGVDRASGDFNIGEMMSAAMRWRVHDQVTIREGEEAEVELVFEEPEDEGRGLVDLMGQVVVGGVPLEEGMVTLFRAGSSAQLRVVDVKGGSFEIPDVRPGTYRAQVQSGVFSGVIGRKQVVRVPEADTHSVRFDLPGGRLTGRVVYIDDGRAASGVIVSLIGAGDDVQKLDRADLGEGAVLTDSEGGFRFDGLEPGSYEILGKELMLSRGVGQSGRLGGLVLGAGEQRTDLALVLQPGATLRVAVTDAAGPRGNALVTLLGSEGRPLDLFQRSLTDADGTVTFAGLPEGQYRALVDAPRAAPTTSDRIRVVPGVEHDLAVMLRPGVEVEVEITGDIPASVAGQPVAYSVWRPDGSMLRSGGLIIPRVDGGKVARLRVGTYEPGRYKLRLESSAGLTELEQEVPAVDKAIWKVDVAVVVR